MSDDNSELGDSGLDEAQHAFSLTLRGRSLAHMQAMADGLNVSLPNFIAHVMRYELGRRIEAVDEFLKMVSQGEAPSTLIRFFDTHLVAGLPLCPEEH